MYHKVNIKCNAIKLLGENIGDNLWERRSDEEYLGIK